MSARAVLFWSAFCVPLLAGTVQASDWKPVVTTSDGIQVFRKEASARGLVEFRGIGVVEAPLPLVATVILDTGRRREWIEGLVESRILRWEGEDNFIEYDHIEMPVFFRDRDFVSSVRMQAARSGTELVFLYRSSVDPAVPATGCIRGEVINMTFRLTSTEHASKTRVEATFLCDPKGWIPVWLVNYFLSDWPQTTFRNLRKEVSRAGIPPDPRITGLLQIGEP